MHIYPEGKERLLTGGKRTMQASTQADGCLCFAWAVGCKTSGIGTGCYPEKVARKLPTKFFECDIEQAPAEEVKAQDFRAVSTSDAPSYTCFSKNETACKDAKACDWCVPNVVCARCVSDGGMGSCFSEDVAKYVPFCGKDAKKAEPAAVSTKDVPSYNCFSKNETACKDAKACDWWVFGFVWSSGGA
eukprot:1145352-Pelagomonas_calceolata.AAC.1